MGERELDILAPGCGCGVDEGMLVGASGFFLAISLPDRRSGVSVVVGSSQMKRRGLRQGTAEGGCPHIRTFFSRSEWLSVRQWRVRPQFPRCFPGIPGLLGWHPESCRRTCRLFP